HRGDRLFGRVQRHLHRHRTIEQRKVGNLDVHAVPTLQLRKHVAELTIRDRQRLVAPTGCLLDLLGRRLANRAAPAHDQRVWGQERVGTVANLHAEGALLRGYDDGALIREGAHGEDRAGGGDVRIPGAHLEGPALARRRNGECRFAIELDGAHQLTELLRDDELRLRREEHLRAVVEGDDRELRGGGDVRSCVGGGQRLGNCSLVAEPIDVVERTDDDERRDDADG